MSEYQGKYGMYFIFKGNGCNSGSVCGCNSIKVLCLPSEKGSKRKEWLPLGANSFLLRWSLFQKWENKPEVTTVASLVKITNILPSDPSPLKSNIDTRNNSTFLCFHFQF